MSKPSIAIISEISEQGSPSGQYLNILARSRDQRVELLPLMFAARC